MRTETVGDGDPVLAVVGSIHGDEPVGENAIENILERGLDFRRPVKFIVANEKALAEDRRCIDTDLNRVFPGDSGSELHEERLAAEILNEIEGLTVLDIHSTMSYNRPFALLSGDVSEEEALIAENIGAENIVYFPEGGDTLVSKVCGVTVETGIQKSEGAVRNAEDVILNFLRYHGAVPGEPENVETRYFRQLEEVKGKDYEVKVQNFEKVDRGEIYAEKHGHTKKAEESFYPVLMSTNGYTDIIGHKAEKISREDMIETD